MTYTLLWRRTFGPCCFLGSFLVWHTASELAARCHHDGVVHGPWLTPQKRTRRGQQEGANQVTEMEKQGRPPRQRRAHPAKAAPHDRLRRGPEILHTVEPVRRYVKKITS